jgi:hypothetical protein
MILEIDVELRAKPYLRDLVTVHKCMIDCLLLKEASRAEYIARDTSFG